MKMCISSLERERENLRAFPQLASNGYRRQTNLPWKSRLQEPLEQVRKEFVTLFIDNLPLYMNNFWLKQIFKYDGIVEDVFVSKKIRKHTNSLFAFVRFSKVAEANQAIRRNDGLLIKGLKMRVSKAKYEKGPPKNSFNSVKQHKTSQGKSAVRDGRSYKDVVDNYPSVQVEGEKDLLTWLSKAMICEIETQKDVKEIEKEIKSKGATSMLVSRLDARRFIIGKIQENENQTIEGRDKEILEEVFKDVKQWHREFRPKMIRLYELIGIPLHLWGDDKLKKIGMQLGEVIKIQYYEDSVESVRIEVLTYVDLKPCSFIKVSDGHSIYKVVVIEVCSHYSEDEIPNNNLRRMDAVQSHQKQSGKDPTQAPLDAPIQSQTQKLNSVGNTEREVEELESEEAQLQVPIQISNSDDEPEKEDEEVEVESLNSDDNSEKEREELEDEETQLNNQERYNPGERSQEKESFKRSTSNLTSPSIVPETQQEVKNSHKHTYELQPDFQLFENQVHDDFHFSSIMAEDLWIDLLDRRWSNPEKENNQENEDKVEEEEGEKVEEEEGEIPKKRGRPPKSAMKSRSTKKKAYTKQQKAKETENHDREEDEAMLTWEIGKLIGMRSENEEGVIEALCRSQRKAQEAQYSPFDFSPGVRDYKFK